MENWESNCKKTSTGIGIICSFEQSNNLWSDSPARGAPNNAPTPPKNKMCPKTIGSRSRPKTWDGTTAIRIFCAPYIIPNRNARAINSVLFDMKMWPRVSMPQKNIANAYIRTESSRCEEENGDMSSMAYIHDNTVLHFTHIWSYTHYTIVTYRKKYIILQYYCFNYIIYCTLNERRMPTDNRPSASPIPKLAKAGA